MKDIDYNAPSKVKNAAKKCKTNWDQNKKLYIGLGIGVTVGAVSVLVLKRKPNMQAITACGPAINFIGRDLTNSNVVVCELERQMHPGNMILWVEKGIVLPSQNMMAKAADVTPGNLSKYLRGLVGSDKVNGQTFINLGEMVAPQE